MRKSFFKCVALFLVLVTVSNVFVTQLWADDDDTSEPYGSATVNHQHAEVGTPIIITVSDIENAEWVEILTRSEGLDIQIHSILNPSETITHQFTPMSTAINAIVVRVHGADNQYIQTIVDLVVTETPILIPAPTPISTPTPTPIPTPPTMLTPTPPPVIISRLQPEAINEITDTESALNVVENALLNLHSHFDIEPSPERDRYNAERKAKRLENPSKGRNEHSK
ncbi:MAG: hypothetical protein FWC89_05020 [Defluviitaleaceae bacterium]|nr:hypothetical protein [Defluviitaleaceae bacterium]